MTTDERRQQPLLLPGKARHVGVLHQIGPMAVILAVGDRESDLVQPRRPVECPPRLLVQPPGFRRQRQTMLRGARHAFGLGAIHLIARAKTGDRACAHILVADASEQIVEQALAQRAVGDLQPFYLQGLERGNQDRESPGSTAARSSLIPSDLSCLT